MKPHLVLARIPGLGPTPEGAMTIFVAMFETEQEAVIAVKSGGPVDAVVEGVIGIAADSLVKRWNISAGTVVQL